MDREVKLRGAIHETIQFWLCMSHELWPLDVGYRSASAFLNQEEILKQFYRIELDSIEKAIYDVMPKISATSLQVDEAGTQLYAFVTPRDLDCSALRQILSKQLPHYMIPDAVYALDSLPLNANGKVDHKSIKTKMAAIIAGAAATTMTSYLVEPGPLDALSGCSAVEIISKIWQNVLNTSQLPSPNENFFDLGGNR